MNLRHIVWKELSLHLRPAGNTSRHYLVRLVPVALLFFGTLFVAPHFLEQDRIEFLVVITSMSLMMVAAISPVALTGDMFAGERERHTLETVLCAPITPRNLYWGKALAHVIVLASGLALATLLVIVLLLAAPVSGWMRSFGFLALPFMVPISAVLGVLVLAAGHLASLRSSSIKEANTRFGIYMVIGISIGFLPTSVLTPLLLTAGEITGPLVQLILLVLQLVTLAAFVLYVGSIAYRTITLTDPENFTIDV